MNENIPPPPEGFTLEQPSAAPPPPPPPGYTLEGGSVPPPPAGFRLETPLPIAEAPAPSAVTSTPTTEESTPPSEPPQPPQPTSKPWAFTRGAVSGLAEQNPTLVAEALEGISHSAPSFARDSLIAGSVRMRDLAKLSPERYKPEAKSFFQSMTGLDSALTWAGETLGSGLASMAPSMAAGLIGAGAGAAVGSVVPVVGTGLGATAGAIGGAASSSLVMNYGEVYKALKDEGIDPRLADQYARIAAPAMAALDTVSVGPLIARLGGFSEVKREAARAVARRIAAEAGKGATREGLTEAAQEAVKVATVSTAADKPFWSIDNVDAIIGSGVGGALTGGVAGSAGGLRADRPHGTPLTEEQVLAELQKYDPTHPAVTERAVGAPLAAEATPTEPQPKWYYSQVRKVAEEKLPESGTVAQMMATLRNAPGVKPEELDALDMGGFEAYRKPDQVVKKSDIIAHLEENALDVQERVLGDQSQFGLGEGRLEPETSWSQFVPNRFLTYPGINVTDVITYPDVPGLAVARVEMEGGRSHYEIYRDGQYVFQRPNLESARAYIQRLAGRDGGSTLYEGYKTPGGENYRELLITLPKNRRSPDRAFESSHWEDKNVLAHTRLTDRVDASGAKTLYVEEVQSDWHQQGREHGYQQFNTLREAIEAEKRMRVKWENLRQMLKEEYPGLRSSDIGNIIDDVNSGYNFGNTRIPGGFSPRIISGIREYKESVAAWDVAWKRDADNLAKIPDAPFKTAWPELVVKRIMKMAADGGYQKVAFANGEENIARYPSLDEGQKAGLREFYDNVLPRTVRKWSEKLSSKLGKVKIEIPGRKLGLDLDGNPEYDVPSSKEFWGFDVTPEMVAKTRRGLPLFSKVFQKGGVSVVESTSEPLDREAQMEVFNTILTMATAIGQLAKRMGVKAPITVKIDPTSSDYASVSGTEISNLPKDIREPQPASREGAQYEIAINPKLARNPEEIFAVFAHEFGHILDDWHLRHASVETRTQIYEAYERWRASLPASGTATMRDVFENRDNAFIYMLRERSWGMHQELSSLPAEKREYWLSFREWWAEQVARWMTTSQKPLTVVDRFFSSLARRIRETYNFFRTRYWDALPEDEVKFYLDGLVKSTNFRPLEIVQALENSTRRQNINAVAAGEGVKDWPGTPRTASSENILAAAATPGLPPQTQGQLKAAAAIVDRFSKAQNWMLGMVQLADQNLHIVPLQRYRELWQVKQLERQALMERALQTIKAWRALHKDQQDAVAKVIDNYMNMTFLSPQEKQQGVRRKPTNAEMAKLAADAGMSQIGLQLFQRIEGDFDNMLTEYAKVMIDKALAITDPIAQANRMQAVAAQVSELRKTPYFPAMHFGDYTVTIKDAAKKVIHFQTFESKRQRDSAAKALQAQMQNGETIHLDVLKKEARPFLGLPRQLLEEIEAKLALSPAQRDALETLKFDLAPGQGFKHRFENKKFVKGYSQDFQKAYANYFFHGSNYLTNIKYVDQMRDRIREVHAEAEAMLDGTKRRQIANYMDDHLNYYLDPKPDWAALRSLAAIWYLGFSPVAALVNLSQIAVGTYPFLSSKFGDSQAVGAISKAGTKLTTFYKRGNLSHATDREMRALAEGVKQGVITEAMAPELAAYSEGRNLKGFGGNVVQESLVRFSEVAMKMFEMTEQINRRVTFRAAFDLASRYPNAKYVSEAIGKHKLEYDRLVQEGWTDHDAAAFVVAKDVTESTQYIYQPYAQPRFMRGKLRTVFVFKTFLQNTLFMLANYPQAAWRSVLVMAFLGGLMGGPGMEDLRGLIKALGWQLFGRDWDIEDEARRFLIELGSGKLADAILHGISRYGFGWPVVAQHLGVPVPVTDMSRSIGLGQISPVDIGLMFGPGTSKDVTRAVAENTQRASGAAFGTAFNLYKAAVDSKLDLLDAKRWEKAAPRFMRAINQSWRAFSQGKEVDRNGNAVIRYDINDPVQFAEALGLAGGFTPLRLSATWDRRFAEMEAVTYWNMRREIILRQLWQARGTDEYERVWGAARAFNKEIAGTPAFGKAITPEVVKRSFESRARAQQARESGAPRTRADIPIVRDIQKYHPNAEIDVRPVK